SRSGYRDPRRRTGRTPGRAPRGAGRPRWADRTGSARWRGAGRSPLRRSDRRATSAIRPEAVMSAHIVAGLDLGSTKTAAVIAAVSGASPETLEAKILGVGQARTAGIRREVVTDIEATTDSVRKAVKEAELMAGVSVERLYTGIAGEH